jgi:hypothetical protein
MDSVRRIVAAALGAVLRLTACDLVPALASAIRRAPILDCV